MTFLTKTLETEKIIEYSYGKKENEFIGTVSFDKHIRNISQDCFDFKYFDGNSFCRATVNAVKAISNFIKNGEYPEKYLRATH